MFTLLDNLGSPMIPTCNPLIWINNLGGQTDIRIHKGVYGAPIIVIDGNGNQLEIESYIAYMQREDKLRILLR